MTIHSYSIIKEKNVCQLLSDGTKLYADVYRPADDLKHPAVLMRQPYSKDLTEDWGFHNAEFFASNGFAVVIQDCRGTGVSDGILSMNRNEAADGAESVEWVAARDWCNGQVCMMGLSYYGATQLMAAEPASELLTAIAPFMIMGVINLGTFQPAIPNWLFGQIEQGMRLGRYPWDQAVVDKMHCLSADSSCIMTVPESDNEMITGVSEYPVIQQENQERLRHIGDYVYWRDMGWEIDPQAIRIPCLFGTGWYDGAKGVTLQHYRDIVTNGGSEAARSESRLIVGPWLHGSELKEKFGGWDFGAEATKEKCRIDQKHLDWFRYWCMHEKQGFMDEAPVQLFLMGANEWRGYSAWPPTEAENCIFYLGSGGHANTTNGDGVLVPESPSEQMSDSYVYDPENPSPGSPFEPMFDGMTNCIEKWQDRSDVLVYTTPPLEEDLNVTGNVSMVLYAASSAVDTDFFVRLTDVYPDGRAFLLTLGMVRARFREGYIQPRFLKPGEICRYQIDLSGTSNLFRKGHCIRVDITSSSFPACDRNHNTDDAIGFGDRLIKAEQQVFSGGGAASYLVLPVIH